MINHIVFYLLCAMMAVTAPMIVAILHRMVYESDIWYAKYLDILLGS